MASTSATLIKQIQKQIQVLRDERQAHLDAIAEIDSTLSALGLDAPAPKRRGRPRKNTAAKRSPRKAGKRSRGTFKVTGEQSILDFVKKAKNPPNAKQINEHWQKEGRGGKADNTISKLVKTKQLIRVKAEGERGSRYQAK